MNKSTTFRDLDSSSITYVLCSITYLITYIMAQFFKDAWTVKLLILTFEWAPLKALKMEALAEVWSRWCSDNWGYIEWEKLECGIQLDTCTQSEIPLLKVAIQRIHGFNESNNLVNDSWYF